MRSWWKLTRSWLSPRQVLIIIAAILAAVVAVSVVLLSGFFSSSKDAAWERLQSSGVLRVGLDPSYPPFAMMDKANDQIIGYDVDLAREIGSRLGVQVEFVPTGFDGLYDALLAQRFDAIVSALPLDPLWTQDVAYSIPYFQAGLVLTVRSDEEHVRDVAALNGRLVGVELGSAADVEARRLQLTLHDLRVQGYPQPADALHALEQGEVQAVVVDAVSALQFIQNGSRVKLAGAPLTDEPYVIAVAPKSRMLLSQINAVLLGLQKEGFLDRLRQRWF